MMSDVRLQLRLRPGRDSPPTVYRPLPPVDCCFDSCGTIAAAAALPSALVENLLRLWAVAFG